MILKKRWNYRLNGLQENLEEIRLCISADIFRCIKGMIRNIGETLRRLLEIAAARLDYVYMGNIGFGYRTKYLLSGVWQKLCYYKIGIYNKTYKPSQRRKVH